MLALGLIATFAVLLFGSANGPALISTPDNPTFDNPFDRGITYNLGLDNPGPGYDATPPCLGASLSCGRAIGSANNCTQGTFWNCLQDPLGPDRNRTYYESSIGDPVVVNLTGLPASGKVRYATISVTCWGTANNSIQMYGAITTWIPSTGGSGTIYLDSFGSALYCKQGNNSFQPLVLHLIPISGTVVDLNANPIPPNLQLVIAAVKPCTDFCHSFRISSISITMFVADPGACTGNDFFTNVGCSFVNFGKELVNAVEWLVEIFRYVGAWLALAGTFIGNFFVIIIWLYAIPGMPIPLQLFVDAYLTSMFGVLIFKIAGLIRGGNG